MAAEYNSANALQRRYVFAPGMDEPIMWYEGSGTTDRRFLGADERGSIVSVTNSAGTVMGIDTYDEYGLPGAANAGPFQYTGQAWLPEVGLYYYKARVYSPTFGRFMQTDPIGYDDQANLYAYVGNDPINGVDPLGLDEWINCIGQINCGGGFDDYGKKVSPCPSGAICVTGKRNNKEIPAPPLPLPPQSPGTKKPPEPKKKGTDKKRSQCAAGVAGAGTTVIMGLGTEGLVATLTFGEIAAGGLAIASLPVALLGGIVVGVVGVVAVGTYYYDQKNNNRSADNLQKSFGVC